MHPITKQPAPTDFAHWVTANQQTIDKWVANKGKTGDHLWAELGKTFGREDEHAPDPRAIRQALEDALYAEQHGLCCYCGNRIVRRQRHDGTWEYLHRAIEHWYPKNADKHRTFAYANLMLTCKESSKIKQTERITIAGKEAQTQELEAIASRNHLSLPNLLEHNRNLPEAGAIPVGTALTIPNPPHCDDSKSEFDALDPVPDILNPTQHHAGIGQLTFERDGTIGYAHASPDPLFDKTFEVLALNCETLKNRRKNKWKNSEENALSDDLPIAALVQAEDKAPLKAIIDKLIAGKQRPDSDGLLEDFYFVEVAFLKNLLRIA